MKTGKTMRLPPELWRWLDRDDDKPQAERLRRDLEALQQLVKLSRSKHHKGMTLERAMKAAGL